jgi:hypothetical protein
MSDAPDSFGAWCFVAAAFCVFIPETAGRSLEVCDFVYLSPYEPSVNIDSLPHRIWTPRSETRVGRQNRTKNA